MKPEFWLEAWQNGRRGFHRPDAHPDLVAHAQHFGGSGRVLVPLAGATLDLGWLRDNGYHAVGVELSDIAAQEVAEREGLEEVEASGPFRRFEGPGITLLVGDFFALTPDILGPIVGIWDRAALVALHPTQRASYVALQRELLGDGRVLLAVLSYDQSITEGPPWSVPPDVVAEHWPEAELINKNTAQLPPRMTSGGFGWLYRV